MSDINNLGSASYVSAAQILANADATEDTKKTEKKGVGDTPDVVVSYGEPSALLSQQPIDLTPPQSTNDGALDQASFSLGQFETSAVNVMAIAKVMQDANIQTRESARLDRAAARDADVSAQKAAADKAREMGSFTFGAAIATSTAAIAGAAISVVGAVKSSNVRTESIEKADSLNSKAQGLRVDALSDTKQAIKVRADAAAMSGTSKIVKASQGRLNGEAESLDLDAAKKTQTAMVHEQEATSISSKGEAAAKKLDTFYTVAATAATESGKILGAGLQKVASDKDAEKSELQAESTVARSRADDATDAIHAYTENIRSIQDKLSAILQAKSESDRAIVQA
ncbi:hypothetical protein [Hyphomicrobium sp. MC1]|uniref:hypothetical protein n=1 Tax=Hyphomicrobium sp. (strain MC1) TaxID=717785 RepID=UPI000213F23A|nr:hypothetical protein [Hyphomicrobium sp. MC1]CCB66719.1 protein of unknown function [Hyphomicrobium sp. MC1]